MFVCICLTVLFLLFQLDAEPVVSSDSDSGSFVADVGFDDSIPKKGGSGPKGAGAKRVARKQNSKMRFKVSSRELCFVLIFLRF